ncbi:MAG: acetyltransferase [Synergistaceae bacterium]|jgi:sugar O-acyltransferase (sialic acid O-acetyltransferase NeuD family)|nr:acetyltransferase [Synergistaceae bacterium]
MTDLVIYGAGGLGRELRWLVEDVDAKTGEWNFLGFLDDRLFEKKRGPEEMTKRLPVLGDFSWLSSRTTPVAVLPGMASPSAKRKIFERLAGHPHVVFPALRHSTALIALNAALGEGSVVSAFCVVAPDTAVGRGSFLNWSSSVGHDSILGDFCSVMPNVSISGGVTVGDRTLIGAGAKILQGLKIGSDATVGIGSVVLTDVPDGCTVLGCPAKIIRRP